MEEFTSASPFTLYNVQRSVSWSGYNYILTVRGGPSFKIYQQGEYSGRIIEYPKTGGDQDWVKMVELWSLNAGDCSFPFFPSVRDPAYSPHNHPPALHYMDGHLGPFNDTEHPQEFNADEPWLPFIEPYGREVEWANVLPALILEKDNICTVDETLVEDLLRRNFSLDLTLWRVKEKLRQGGVPNSNLLTFPPADAICQLSGSASYQHVLRHIITIQRALRRKHACIAYYSVPPLAGPDRHRPLSELFRGKVIPQANMTCMGLWGNALNWEQLAWYHNVAKVPIYFSHELTTEEMAEMIKHETYTCSELHIFDAHFLNSPYDSFAIEKAIGIVSDSQPSGACTSANQTFESCTAYSSSRSQGHTEMREPRSRVALAQALDCLRDGYHNYEWEEDLFPGWHADVSSRFGRTVDRHRISLVEAPQVAEVHLPLERWGHVFQVHDESILSDAQGMWCFIHAEKDDKRFTHQKFITWYDRTLSTVIHFTLPGTLAFPSGYVLSDYHIETYGAPPPPWRVYTSADSARQTLHQSLPLQWMYRHFEDSHSAGRTPPASDVTLLPFMDNPLNCFETAFIPRGDGAFAAHVDATVMIATPAASYADALVITTAPAAACDAPPDPSATAVDDNDKGKAHERSSTMLSVEDSSNPTEQISSDSQSNRYNAERSAANRRATILTISARDLHAVALRLDALIKWELDTMKD